MNTLFLKMAFRHLLKNKLYTFINIFGLAIGVASFVLIMLFVRYEKSYDVFKGSENVYRVFMDYTQDNAYVPGDAQAYIVSGETIRDKFPEVKGQVRFRSIGGSIIKENGEVYSKLRGSLTDPTYFDIFNRNLEKGDVRKALKEPYSVVLSNEMALKIFGNKDPLGKTFSFFWGKKILLTVTGVLENAPRNTHLKNDFLISFSTFWSWEAFKDDWDKTWNQNNYFTYIKVAPHTDIETLRKKIMAIPVGDFTGERHNIEPIESIHLNSHKPFEAEANGNANNVRLLFAIALVVILLSWLNFINLATAKSLERAPETGIKKVVGAKQLQLIWQLLLESFMLTLGATVLAACILVVFLPSFNNMTGLTLQWNTDTFKGLLPLLGYVFLGSALFAFYPALMVSKFGIIKSLNGKLRPATKGFSLRKVLVVGQFLATIVLLLSTLTISRQINFLQNQPIGANLDQVIALRGEVLSQTPDSIKNQQFNTLRAEIEKLPNVKGVTVASTYPGGGFNELNSSVGITFPNGQEDKKRVWYHYGADFNYFDLMGIPFVAGGSFTPTTEGWGYQIVINTQFARFVGFSNVADAVDKTVKFGSTDWIIKGVVDYHHLGLKETVEPMLIGYGRFGDEMLVKLKMVNLSSSGTKQSLAHLESIWKRVFPESTFDYTFVDQKFAAQYEQDRKFANAFGIFTILAMIIAGLGLFGLTTYISIQRTKEIGIRKVNGATIAQILYLLNRDVLKWVALAFVISVPLAWYMMHQWLENFAFRIPMNWWVFALAGGLTLLVALLTVSWQSFKAAIGNPVDALRDE